MKEKETVTVVCSHCGQPHEVEVKHRFLFYEEWNDEWRHQNEAVGFGDCQTKPGADYGTRYDFGGDTMQSTKVSKPQQLINWELGNPAPKTTLNEFVHQLHERVSALEAEAVQKGGLR